MKIGFICPNLPGHINPMSALARHLQEQVYRDDLTRVPENGWALFGLARSLEMQLRDEQAAEVESRFQKIWSKADMQITSSCLCRPGS